MNHIDERFDKIEKKIDELGEQIKRLFAESKCQTEQLALASVVTDTQTTTRVLGDLQKKGLNELKNKEDPQWSKRATATRLSFRVAGPRPLAGEGSDRDRSV